MSGKHLGQRGLQGIDRVSADAFQCAADGADSPYDALAFRALVDLGRSADGEALRPEYERLTERNELAGLGSVEDRLLYRVLTLTTPDASR